MSCFPRAETLGRASSFPCASDPSRHRTPFARRSATGPRQRPRQLLSDYPTTSEILRPRRRGLSGTFDRRLQPTFRLFKDENPRSVLLPSFRDKPWLGGPPCSREAARLGGPRRLSSPAAFSSARVRTRPNLGRSVTSPEPSGSVDPLAQARSRTQPLVPRERHELHAPESAFCLTGPPKGPARLCGSRHVPNRSMVCLGPPLFIFFALS